MTAVQRLAMTVAGIAADGMVQGGGRLFLDLGRRLERAIVTAASLATVLDAAPDRMEPSLRLALELCDSVLTYRSRYLATLEPAPVLDLVLAEPGNPRALAFQFEQAAALLDAAGASGLAGAARELRTRAERIAAAPVAAAPGSLLELAGATAALSDQATRRFFALLPPARELALATR